MTMIDGLDGAEAQQTQTGAGPMTEMRNGKSGRRSRGKGRKLRPRHTNVGDTEAERRRVALQRVLDDIAPLTAAEWARKAGLPNANSIYNFLTRASSSLHPQTYEKLAAALPGLSVEQLRGEGARRSVSPAEFSVLVVRGTVAAGVLRDRAEADPEDQYRTGVPLPLEVGERMHGLILDDTTMESVYPRGALLVVCPLRSFAAALEDGDRVIVEHAVNGKVEVLCRAIVRGRDGHTYLVSASADPTASAPERLPWPYQGEKFGAAAGGQSQITAVVTAVFLRQAALERVRRIAA